MGGWTLGRYAARVHVEQWQDKTCNDKVVRPVELSASTDIVRFRTPYYSC